MEQTIMIVDDEMISRRIAEETLKKRFRSCCCKSGKEALERLADCRPGLLLIDIHMPKMDGYELLRQIRMYPDQELSGLPVIFMTSDEDIRSEVRGFDMGARDYIRKPLLPEVLLRRVERVLESEAALKALEEKAENDELTGLMNRSALMRQIDEHVTFRGERGVFLMLDLDRFKSINDVFGHDTGDRMLKEIATILRGYVRSEDILGRIGGDEFVILYKGFRDTAAIASRCQEICDRIHDRLHELLGEKADPELGASIGIAMAPEDGMDFSTLYQKADQAMYESKLRGRGGFSFCAEGEREEAGEASSESVISISQLKSRLEERNYAPGAYRVSYEDFCSIFRFLQRAGERERLSVPVQLILFTEETPEAGFGNYLSRRIRRGDVMVRCGSSQYMVMLVGTDEEHGKQVADRILQGRGTAGSRNALRYEMNKLIG